MGLSRRSILLVSLLWIWACGGSTTSGDDGTQGAAEAGADTTAVNDSGIGTDGGPWSCDEKTRAAIALLKAAAMMTGTDLSCQANDDCRVVWLITSCSDTCSFSTTRTGEEKIKAAIVEANTTVCSGFREAGCNRISPPCDPPRPWVCTAGMCAFAR